MAANTRSKEIQVQKPAQSLQAFQAKIASGEDIHGNLLKPILLGAGVLVLAVLSVFGFTSWRSSVVEKHETALASLLQEVQGDPQAPPPAVEVEKRMRERLPRLEALLKSSPSSRRAATEGILATWRLELDGTSSKPAVAKDAWSQLRLAQRQIALGLGKEALATLTPLRNSAKPDESWGGLYWSTLLTVRQLEGDRESAWKDYAEYKARFREQADATAMEHILAGI